MELARGIEPPTCGLQNLSQENQPDSPTSPQQGKSDASSTTSDTLWDCI